MFLFKHFEFLKLWLGQVTSQAGNKVYLIALSWWILTNNPENGGFYLGCFMIAGVLPAMLLFKPMGKVVDSTPSRKMLVCCDLTTATLLATLGWLLIADKLTLVHIMIYGLFVGTVEGFFNPAVAKAVPALVKDPVDLEKAVAYQSSTQYMASFGGAMLGASLISVLGIPKLVALTSLNFLISALIEMTLKFPEEAAKTAATAEAEAEGETATETPAVAEIATEPQPEGPAVTTLDWKNHSFLWQLLVGFGLVNLFAVPDLLIMPVYVQKALHAEANVLAMVEAAIWVGILTGTFAASYIKSDNRTVLLGVVCMLVSGLVHLLPWLIVDFKVFAAALFISGITVGLNNVKFVTMFQQIVADEIKGSFFARMQAIISFSFPVAYLSFGFLSDHIKTPTLCLVQSVGIFITALWFARLINREKGYRNASAT